MKRSEMVCDVCVKFNSGFCRLEPRSVAVPDPHRGWCSQGRWHQWSAKYQEMEAHFWGEWEEYAQ